MPSEITFPDPSGYTETPWTDPNGKQWVADSKGRWSAYKADTGGGSGAWDDITGKPAAITALTGTNTGDETTSTIKTKLGVSTLSGSNTGDQDLSGLLTISTAASTYAPISTTVTLAGTQTLTNKSISAGQITGLGALATSTDAANLTGNIARARIDNALSANAAPIVATTVTASGAVTGSNVVAGSANQFQWTSRARANSPSDGVIALYNSTNNNFGRIQMGGTTSAFPAIKRNGDGISIRLADDSADAPLTCSGITASGTVTGSNFKRGTGSPESVVSGSVGELYTRTDGGAGTTLYVKESGTGNTGWVAK